MTGKFSLNGNLKIISIRFFSPHTSIKLTITKAYWIIEFGQSCSILSSIELGQCVYVCVCVLTCKTVCVCICSNHVNYFRCFEIVSWTLCMNFKH